MFFSIVSELRGAIRRLMDAPIVAFAAILCIGLALGATTAIWSAVDRALLQPLPFNEPERLVTVYRTTPHFDTGPFSAPNYTDLARGSTQLSHLAAASPVSMLLSLDDGAYQVSGHRVTGNFFPMLGVVAARGRMLAPADDAPGEEPVVVISHELWRDRFGASERMIDSSILLDGRAHVVAGVAPPRLGVPQGAARILKGDIWIPMRFSADESASRRSNFVVAMGRLAPGATVQTAHAELRRIFDGIIEGNAELSGEQVRALALDTERVRTVRAPLLLVMSAVGMVLLIAVTNVASLLLARGVQRQREIAIRAALGASRWRIMMPMIAESAVLVAGGLLLGLALAWLGVRTIGVLAVERLPQLDGLAVDMRMVGVALALSLIVALLAGAAPAWRSRDAQPQDALRDGRGGGSGRGHHRALNALVVAEVALSLVLLIGAGLVMRGFATLMGNDPGFDPEQILTMEVTIAGENYPEGTSVPRFLYPALDAIRSVPGVEEAAAVTLIPYTNWGWNFNIRYEGRPVDDPTRLPLTETRTITPEFFDVTRQRLLAGRTLEASDITDGAPIVVVANEALVRRDFPDSDPLGSRYHLGPTAFATIVGVVSDIRNSGPFREPAPEVYYPYRRGGTSFPIMIRVAGNDPTTVAQGVQAAIRQTDPGAAVTKVRPMTTVIADSVGRPRFFLSLLGVFAVVAMVLALAGLYGVMSYVVVQRTREFGIRSALGSTLWRTMTVVLRHVIVLIGSGVALGLLGGYAATRLLVTLLYGVSPLDPSAWITATALLASAGLVAALLPAARAARVDPAITMRVEG
jgi:putative ABC transport system permease protein